MFFRTNVNFKARRVFFASHRTLPFVYFFCFLIFEVNRRSPLRRLFKYKLFPVFFIPSSVILIKEKGSRVIPIASTPQGLSKTRENGKLSGTESADGEPFGAALGAFLSFRFYKVRSYCPYHSVVLR